MLETKPTDNREVLYRYKNAWGELVCLQYPIISHTKSCVWVEYLGDKKLVSMHTRKRFAYPTKQEALLSFIARTERHIMLSGYNLSCARAALAEAKVIRDSEGLHGRDMHEM